MPKLSFLGKFILACCGFLIVSTVIRFVTGTMLAALPTIAVGIAVCFGLAMVHSERASIALEEQMIAQSRERSIQYALYNACHDDVIKCYEIFNDESMTPKRRLIEAQAFMIERGYDTELANTPEQFQLFVKRDFGYLFDNMPAVFSQKLELPHG